MVLEVLVLGISLSWDSSSATSWCVEPCSLLYSLAETLYSDAPQVLLVTVNISISGRDSNFPIMVCILSFHQAIGRPVAVAYHKIKYPI